MNGIYMYFVNKHLYSWALLGLECTENLPKAKSFDRGQTARTAQADHGRYFSQFPYGPFSRDGSHLNHTIYRYEQCFEEDNLLLCRRSKYKSQEVYVNKRYSYLDLASCFY